MSRRHKTDSFLGSRDVADLGQALLDYGQRVKSAFDKEVKDSAEELAKSIKKDAPVRKSGTSHDRKGNALKRGTYQCGWSVRKLNESQYRVYNSGKQYPLVHLLEFGHVFVDGSGTATGSAPAIPHVIPNRDKAEQELVEEVERILKDVDL